MHFHFRHARTSKRGVANSDSRAMYVRTIRRQSVTLMCASFDAARSTRSPSPGFPIVRENLILIDAISGALTINSCVFSPIFDDFNWQATAIA
ncbi:hypothetical protein [Bradyrhizobium sp. WSM2793]|uniref:hypothetical protein n=1 Tax=Bradyrhizobium sp. WSM2793 TaxID=1038866 RepID=UPI0012FC1839|nr:hypothetical protein [Bradyrhizobium sp. WSM2793]